MARTSYELHIIKGRTRRIGIQVGAVATPEKIDLSNGTAMLYLHQATQSWHGRMPPYSASSMAPTLDGVVLKADSNQTANKGLAWWEPDDDGLDNESTELGVGSYYGQVKWIDENGKADFMPQIMEQFVLRVGPRFES